MCKWIPIKHSDISGKDVIVSDLPREREPVFVTIRSNVRLDVFETLPNGVENFIYYDDIEAWMRFPKPYNLNDRSDLWVPIGHDPLWCLMLPDDGERVLITVDNGFVQIDVFRIKTDGTIGFDHVPIDNVTAWMKFPAPYVPRRCRDCRYGMTTYDDDDFRRTRCELDGVGVISNYKPKDCPLKKEVINHGSN